MKIRSAVFTWHLHVTGQVQGVGYRPTVYRIAQDFGIVGHVKNESDGLHVVFNASIEVAEEFRKEICHVSKPPLSRITDIQFRKLHLHEFNDFRIIHGSDDLKPKLLLTPDVGICSSCCQELSDLDNRRNAYSFNSCSQCGPRYSIVSALPYDRANTEMHPFKMCTACEKEYLNPADRRYYAQTVSCPECAIRLRLYMTTNELISSEANDIIDQVVRIWDEGKIVAIKGIGGFLLTCDAENEDTLRRLRKLKSRPTKPLAIMYPDLAALSSFDISEEVTHVLSNNISPITLIPKGPDANIARGICDNEDHVGVMLPYAPVFKVLLNRLQRPIVATSGNRSNSPIVYTEAESFEELSDIADYILTNNRKIVVPQDDSVVKFSEFHNQKIILRRSRGMAPSYVNPELKLDIKSSLATGAQFKSTFSLHHAPNTYISQYIGDLDSFDTLANYKHCLGHLTDLLQIEPKCVLSDEHRGYESTIYGQKLADRWNVPIFFVPHHKAHFSAIIGEHNLIDSDQSVLGVIWDGAGLGDNGTIWGSEFFIYKDLEFSRCNHLSYFDLLLGDKMAKEPRISALSLGLGVSGAVEILQQKFSSTEWNIYTRMLENGEHLRTSSMGRLFDAVASILGLKDIQSFEGEAPMMLEVSARSYFGPKGIRTLKDHYLDNLEIKTCLPTKKIVECIVNDLIDGLDCSCVAAKFHLTLIKWIEKVAQIQDCKKIAFSGGVFQNSLLIDLAIKHLSSHYELHFHQQLSPNDENISFGQLIYHQITNKRAEKG